MIFQSIFANWLIFCQGGGPRCFVKYSPVQRYQGTKGAKDTWVKSSEGLLGGRVFSRTHFRSSLTPEEEFLLKAFKENSNFVSSSKSCLLFLILLNPLATSGSEI